MFYYWDQYYFLLVVPAFIISLIAQINVKSTFSKYSNVRASSDVTANSVVERILRENLISNVTIERIRGNLTDHFDPRTNTIRLSDTVNMSNSVAAIGVAAHETGHALQHNKGYLPVKIRSALVPVANFGSQFGIILAFIGLMLGPNYSFLVNLGIILFSAAVLFYLVTLPVEFNASKRAVAILSKMPEFSERDIKAIRKVLFAAALTYVAAALTSMANLLRLILLARDNNRRK